MRNERYAPSSMESSWGGGMSQRVFDTRVMPLFGGGLIMAAFVSYILLGRVPQIMALVALFGAIGINMTVNKWSQSKSSGVVIGLFMLMAALVGVMMTPLITWATITGGPGLILQAFVVTGVTFGSLMLYGMVTQRDFTFMGRFLFLFFIGFFFTGLFSIFMPFSTTFHLIFSMIGVVLFSAYTIYYMQIIQRQLSDQEYVLAALMLFTSFVNLFQNILVIMGIMGDD